MHKRTFIKTIAKSTLSIVAGQSLLGCNSKQTTSTTSSPKEQQTKGKLLPNNWVWMRPDIQQSDDYWKAKFDELLAANIQAILPQVYASRETLFEHPSLPVKTPWLERILPLAHAAGLQVHAWMWTMILNNEEWVNKHPDWFSVNRKGEPAHTHPAYVNYYKFMDPCHPKVAEFVQSNVEALAKIEDLDGIHLDYVRQPDVILAEGLQPKYNIVQDREYPEYDYPYSERCRAQFKEEFGVDPLELDEPVHHKEWRQFRYDRVTNIVNNYCVPMAKKYDKTITAAVFPNWESVRQQWHRWHLDAFLPMLYHGFYKQNIEWIGEEVQKAKVRLNNDIPVYSGLFLGHLSTAEELKKAVEVSHAAGAKGVSFFALGGLKPSYLQVMQGLK